ncbi:MAG: histidine kinase, partial [Devosia sp.]|nr:histidine kinase [Devosia sp.]
ALVVLAATAALIMMQGIDRQLRDVIDTYEVRNQARELTNALAEAESSQRGYLLTGDDSFIDPYRRASAAIQIRMLSLTALTKERPNQADRMAAIAAEVALRTAEMERNVQLVRAMQSDRAEALTKTGMGARLMDSVRDSLELFIREENQRLGERNRAIDASRRWLVGAVITALAAAAILAYSLFSRSQRLVVRLVHGQSALQSQNELLEGHVRERTQALEEARAHAEHERQRVEALLQDTNHRIGNSLATVSSMLGLQLLRTKSPEVQRALESARSRVHAIASAHRRLRLGDDLETTRADEFMAAVLEDLKLTASNAGSVELLGDVEPILMGARDATTIGILVGELVTNALKHAFPDGRRGTINVQLRRSEAGVPTLTVADNGVGIPPDQDMGEGGLGSVIIKQLAMQFGGEPVYQRLEQGGTAVTVTLPAIESADKPNRA